MYPVIIKFSRKLNNIKEIQIIDSSYKVIADEHPEHLGRITDNRNMINIFHNPEDSLSYSGKMGNVYLISVYPIEGNYNPLTESTVIGAVSMTFDVSHTEQKIMETFLKSVAFIFPMLIIIYIIIYVVINRTVICRLKKLSDATTRFGTGELTARSSISGHDEIGILSDKFNIMADLIEAGHKKQEEEISERKQIQERQTQLIKEIEGVNNELKDFAYIVSHDIKSPLRAITSLAEWLVTDYSDKLGKEGKASLNMIKERSRRLLKMIDAVLLYSRAGQEREEKEEVDLNELVTMIIDLIAPAGNIRINTDEILPKLYFDRTKIQQVFQNLISNAVKYMDKPEGIITISCVNECDCYRFSVSDNGPGIEEKDFDRIFKIFQTAHQKDNTDSTGIGLSIVKKIVEKSGGRIWLESKIGEGTTFYFTIPA